MENNVIKIKKPQSLEQCGFWFGAPGYKVKTNKNGYATLKIPSKITPGKYTIKATYKGQTVKNKLTVKQVLKTKKTVTVKKSAKKLVLSATLKKGKTNAIKTIIGIVMKKTSGKANGNVVNKIISDILNTL